MKVRSAKKVIAKKSFAKKVAARQNYENTKKKFKKQVKRISKFFGMDSVKCTANPAKSIRVMQEYAQKGHVFTALFPNRSVQTPPELKLPFGMPVVVVDPTQPKKKVKRVLKSEVVKTYFNQEKLSFEQLMQRFGFR